jgi:hypothetical protein
MEREQDTKRKLDEPAVEKGEPVPMKKRKLVTHWVQCDGGASDSDDELSSLRAQVDTLQQELSLVKSELTGATQELRRVATQQDECNAIMQRLDQHIADHLRQIREGQQPSVKKEFLVEEFKRVGKKVDVEFDDGWFCGHVSSLAGKTQIWVSFANGDAPVRLRPKEGDIRECLHEPQLLCASVD